MQGCTLGYSLYNVHIRQQDQRVQVLGTWGRERALAFFGGFSCVSMTVSCLGGSVCGQCVCACVRVW